MADDLPVAEIECRLREKPLDLVRRLEIQGKVVGRKFLGASTSEGGVGDSFAVELVGPRRGLWNHSTRGGDMLDLIEFILCCRKADAVRYAKAFLGIEEGRDLPAPRARAPQRDAAELAEAEAREKRNREWAREIFREARPIAGTPSERYLEKRLRRRLAVPQNIKHHPGLRHPETGFKRHPCLVAARADVAGEFVGIWRIYLRPDGSGKADVDKAKLGLGSRDGVSAPVWLGHPAEKMHTCEGLETGLAVLGRFPEASIWPALSTSGIRGLVLPELCREIVIWADNDAPDLRETLEIRRPDGSRATRPNPNFGKRPGREAAEAAAARFRSEGRRVVRMYPGTGDDTDFLDVFALADAPS